MVAAKHIVFLTRELVPFFYGGIGTQFKALARLLSEEGHRITMLSQRPDNFEEAIFQEHYSNVALRFVDHEQESLTPEFSPSGGLISTFQYTYSLAVARAFDELIASSQVDCVICADFGAEGFFLLKRKTTGFYDGIRFVLFIEGSLFDTLTTYQGSDQGKFQDELLDPQNRLSCAIEDACVHMADDLIVPTELTWQQTTDRLKLTRSANIIANIADDRLFDPNLDHWAQQHDKQIALFVGRLDRHKGADILLEAFIKMYSGRPDDAPELVFVGRDTFNKQYQATFREYWQDRIPQELASHIVFLGQVPHNDVIKYFEKATVAIFPSRWEVFGIVCLEAMSYGCPVIVSKDTGLEEVVGSDLNDFVVDFQTQSEKLEDLFKTFFHDPEWNAKPLRKQVIARASSLEAEARHCFKEFFMSEAIDEARESSVNSQQLAVIHEEASQALIDILSIVSNDFLRLSDWAGLSSQGMKQVLTTESYRFVEPDKETMTGKIMKIIQTAFGR